MKNGYLRLLVLPAALLYASVPGMPQDGGEQGLELRGEIHGEGGPVGREYVIELYDMQRHALAQRGDVGSDGRFDLERVAAGDYLVRITDRSGNLIHEEFASLSRQTGALMIQLPKQDEARPPSGPVSVTQLLHPPAKKAVAAARAAERWSASGEPEKAAAELEKAIRISPDYAAAYTNLAAQHIRMQRYGEAVGEIERAIQLSQLDAADLSNLGYAQLMLGHYGDARRSVDAALRLRPDSPNAHWVLGALLVRDRRTTGEGMAHLERAAQEIPAARAYLERVRAAVQ